MKNGIVCKVRNILGLYWVVFDEPTDEGTVAAAPQQKAIPG